MILPWLSIRFKGGIAPISSRSYLYFELDRKLHTEVCTYEIAVEGIKERKVLLSESSIDYASWWTGQILAGDPIILLH